MGYCLSVVCLAWVLHGYQFNELLPAIRTLDWGWVTIAVLSDLSVYVVHGWRWNTLLEPVARLRLTRTVQAIYIGLFANEILPLRVGEVIRCYLLAHWNNLNLSVTLASVGVERLIDGFWMIAAFLITTTYVKGIPPDLNYLVRLIGVLQAGQRGGVAVGLPGRDDVQQFHRKSGIGKVGGDSRPHSPGAQDSDTAKWSKHTDSVPS